MEDRFKPLRKVVILLVILFSIDTVLLATMMTLRTPFSWIVIGIQAVIVAYFAAISFGLIKQLRKKEESK